MAVDAGTIAITLKLINQFSGDHAAALKQAQAEYKELAAALKAANADLAVLNKQAGDLGTASANVRAVFTQPIAEATTKVKELTEQLAQAKKVVNQLNKPEGGEPSFFDTFTKQALAFGASMVGFQAVLSGIRSAWGAFTDFLTSSVDAWAAQELASMRLTAALRAQAFLVPSVVDQYSKLATAYQNTTAFADREITTTQALLSQLGDVLPGDMDKALKATTDLSAGLGIELETAARIVGKAFEGQTQTLQRYGIVIDQTRAQTEGITYILDELEKKFGGQAQAQAQTYAGQIKQLGNDFENLKEAVGKSIVQNPIFQEQMNNLREALKGANAANVDATHSWSEFLLKLHGASGTFNVVLDQLAAWADHAENAADWTNELVNATKRALALPKPFEHLRVGATGGLGPGEEGPTSPGVPQAALVQAHPILEEADKVLSVIQSLTRAEHELSIEQEVAAKFAFQHGASVTEATLALRAEWPEIDKMHFSMERLRVTTLAEMEANKQWDRAAEEVESIGETWKDTLESIDEWTLNDIRHKLQQGASIQQLAIYYGLMSDVVRALTKEQAEMDRTTRLAVSSFERQITLMKSEAGGALKNLGYEGQIQLLDRVANLDRARTQLLLEQIGAIASETTKLQEQQKVIEEFEKRDFERTQQRMGIEEKMAVLRDKAMETITAQARANAEARGISFTQGTEGLPLEMAENPFVKLAKTMGDINLLMQQFKLSEAAVAPLRQKANDDFITAMGGDIQKIQTLGEAAEETAKKLHEIAAAPVGHEADVPTGGWSSLVPKPLVTKPIAGGIFDLSGMSPPGNQMPMVTINVSGILDPATMRELARLVGAEILKGTNRQFPSA